MTTLEKTAPNTIPAYRRLLCGALVLAAGLSACADEARDNKPGQAIASVNGEEITVLQLNEELQRAGIGPAQQDAASKQLLQGLIDRQLLQSEAAREKLDRDPKIMQAVERAKAMIVAQAYLQKRIGSQPRPSAAEVEAYFTGHPEFFTRRKQFVMEQLVISSRDLSDELKAAADSAKSLEEVAVWLDARQVRYARNQVTRSTADLAPALSKKLLAMPEGRLFIVKEGERSMLVALTETKEAPVTLAVAAPQIEQFLANKKNKETAAAELARLRAGARIVYLNKAMQMDAKPASAPASAPNPAPGPASGPAAPDPGAKAAIERGVQGLK